MDNDYDGVGYLAFLIVLLPILLIFAVAGYVISSLFLMRIFDKAGVQGKWRAWVPVYNAMVFAKLGDLSPWVMLGAIVASSLLSQVPVIGWLISLAALAVGVIAGWRVGLKLGKDWPYLLLWLIPGVGTLIWLGILAFDKSPWNQIAPAPWANSFLKDTTTWAGIPNQVGAAGYAAGPSAGYAGPPAAPGAFAPPAGPPAPPSYAPPATPPAAAYPPPAAPEPPAGPPAPPTAPPAAPEPPVTPGTTPPAAPAPDGPDAPRP
ncbi:MAG TPA: large exoprotein [Microbacterium sp.]|uniref:large exoprotein n=1 Tax=Microbacterium sp. TaxID=51671 RepID=UPI002B9CB262|nr:large exoprotein [Microbacterium sp.]HWI32640.1 large exoprotein [Microbacterium sp.]